MSARSGLDMIAELLKEVKLVRKEIKVLDQNMKKIANSAKITEIVTKALDTPLKDWAKPGIPKPKAEAVDHKPTKTTVNQDKLRFTFETTDASKTKQESPNRSARKPPTSCMCHGKMVVRSGSKSVPIPNLSVKIFDDKDRLVKETKTNRAGNWMSQLPSGNYVANIEGKFNGKDLYPVNLVFHVKSGMTKLEVK